MGLYQNIKDILKVIYNDETLLRLLYYPAADLATDTLDPLDLSLPNILSIELEQRWNIINLRVLMTPKDDDLDSVPICRLLIYIGNRSPHNANYLQANQQLVIDLFVHFNFENKDVRTSRIADRLNQLLVEERITGIGKVNYTRGQPLPSPAKEYVAYRHVYEFGSVKK